jgi:tungstate transport system substrate-binding protein
VQAIWNLPKLLSVVLAVSVAASCTNQKVSRRIALATTTSVDNSGLLNVLLPAFRRHTRIDVQLVTPGSGIALSILAKGDVDVVISHAPEREVELLRHGRPWFYRKIMFNNFVIVGPPNDPARVKEARTPEDAMRKIAESRVRFISRGDSSGTHERERALWASAGLKPDQDQVVVAGSGMGATLRIAGTMGAYTLTDTATFAQHAERGDLMIVFEDSRSLVNTYAVIARADVRDARDFAEWLADGDGRRLIAGYITSAGTPAFIVWPDGCPRDSPSATSCAVPENARE